MSTQYTNSTKSIGINITEATPIDDRTYFKTLADLLDATLVSPSALLPVLYDGIKIFIQEDRKTYVWVESVFGVLGTGHTYPAHATDVRGQDYSGKTFNFVLTDRVAKYTVKYTSTSLDGLIISKGLLPDHLLKDLDNIFATMKSSADAFSEQQYPSHIEVGAIDITIICDPKPELNEEFKITLT